VEEDRAYPAFAPKQGGSEVAHEISNYLSMLEIEIGREIETQRVK
jgi:hypothetical protein